MLAIPVCCLLEQYCTTDQLSNTQEELATTCPFVLHVTLIVQYSRSNISGAGYTFADALIFSL